MTLKQPSQLLTAVDIEAMSASISVHDLNPNAVRHKKSLGDSVGLTQLGVYIITIMPGHESSEYHRHLYEEEFAYVLSGRGEAQIGEQVCSIGPGDFLGFARRGPAHVMVNTGSEPLVCLVSGQRLEHDVCDYPRKGLRLYIAGENEVHVKL
ncbi:cupin domain-containing protein [Dyella monticola]|uniref:Cupin domain-containing protein n=1 Tax=Dyella monticola TaxID=1927958 RepID=A0A370WUQ7_9GAMM|nr:cupin domain-containing protein [Dyella monticola]RDS79873.1 cupin domain-containing protein [Dyella monticola]